jgi:hypothetical protein
MQTKRRKRVIDYEESSAEDEMGGGDPDFMDVDEDVKKTPAKVKARVNTVEGKSKETPVRIKSEDQDSKPKPKFKYATFLGVEMHTLNEWAVLAGQRPRLRE